MIIQRTIRISDESEIPIIIEKSKQEVLELVTSKEFINFVAKRASESAINIALEGTESIGSDVLSEEEVSRYLSSFNTEIGSKSFTISNMSEIDLSSKNMSQATARGYGKGLSLSQLIEYGMGYTGLVNTQFITDPTIWQYDVNNHGYKGWYYVDENGQTHWTNGMEGRLIFLKLSNWVYDNLPKLIEEFISNNVKD